MASENGENSIDDRDLDNDADFLQNRGFHKGYDSIRSMFLHNSNHPRMVLVTAPLTGSNYLTWSRSMKIALIAKQKLGFVNGKCVQSDMNSKEYEGWLRADSMVISWILNSISKDIVDAFLYTNTAKDLWDELGERFGECNGPLIYQIQREIASISQGTMSVSQYYTKLKKAWDELNCLMLVLNYSCRPCTCGNVKAVASILSNNQLMQFLMGLNESFDSVRSQILLLDPLPSVNKVYSMVLRIEKQREVSDLFTENLENTAMFARSSFTKPAGRSHGYSRTDLVHPKGPTRGQVHSSRKGYGSQSDSMKPFCHCDYCNNDGHVRDTCFRLHGYPDWYKEYKARTHAANMAETPLQTTSTHTSQNQYYESAAPPASTPSNVIDAAHFAHLEHFAGIPSSFAFTIQDSSNIGTWIVDTGASTHMCSDFSLLVNPAIVTSPMHVSLPDGSQVSVQYSGTVVLNRTLELHNVLYIPKFQFNLLSVPKLATTSNIIFKFYPNNCLLQDLKTEHLVAVVKLVNHLYILDQSSFQIDSTVTILPACNNAKTDGISLLWHQRLGHASYRTIHHLPVCTNLLVQSSPCHVCPLAKQSRLPFPISTIHTSNCFDILHIDIWGPYKIPSLTGARFFLTIVDDFSRATWTFLLHHKTDIFHIFSTFLTMVPTQFKTRVKTIHSDNGGEFLSTCFKTLHHSYGIIHHRSFPYTPQQNGVVEHKHRHLLDTTRSLMFQASLLSPFWGHAILMATSIINRLPSSLLSWKTPFKRLYHKPPTYDLLKVFGCLCFATITQPHRDKFSPCATRCIFLGLSPRQKAFKLYDLSTHNIFVSRDVKFHENIFPFQDIPSQSIPTPLPNPPFFDNQTSHPTISPLPSSHPTPIITLPSPPPIIPTPSPALANPPYCPTQSMAPRRSTRL